VVLDVALGDVEPIPMPSHDATGRQQLTPRSVDIDIAVTGNDNRIAGKPPNVALDNKEVTDHEDTFSAGLRQHFNGWELLGAVRPLSSLRNHLSSPRNRRD